MSEAERNKVTVVGSGYVGMSLAALLAQKNVVTVMDIDPARVNRINDRKTTIADNDIELLLSQGGLNLSATDNDAVAYHEADFVVVATPTDYDPNSNKFDTRSVDAVVTAAVAANPNCLIVIKSTIPVGHTRSLQLLHSTNRIIFSPEFLREGRALYDNQFPSRIIVGNENERSAEFAILLEEAATAKSPDTLLMSSSEAEAVKLFANTYLAMRVAFFNELDSYALRRGLSTGKIIEGVCLDQRIGKGYNNPSFGYGGYCLPKDTKQLLADFEGVPQSLIGSVVSSNAIRKDFIADEILRRAPKTVGFFRLIMKEGSDNFRSSAIQGIMHRLKASGVEVVIFEPALKSEEFLGSEVVADVARFKSICDIIIANRRSDLLQDVEKKVFSRDIFGVD